MKNRIKNILLESVGGRLYHGTDSKDSAMKILESGELRPGNEDKKRRDYFAPMVGRTYFAQSLSYAIPYVLGGAMAGHEYPKGYLEKRDPYGYLFIVDRDDVKSPRPDEDYVGEMVDQIRNEQGHNYLLQYRSDPKEIEFWNNVKSWKHKRAFLNWAESILTDKQYKDVTQTHRGETIYHANIGKKLNMYMNDEWAQEIIDMGSSFSALGNVPIKEAWRVEKAKSVELKPNGSNFFDMAERIF